jgi:hypothetical protein
MIMTPPTERQGVTTRAKQLKAGQIKVNIMSLGPRIIKAEVNIRVETNLMIIDRDKEIIQNIKLTRWQTNIVQPNLNKVLLNPQTILSSLKILRMMMSSDNSTMN